MVKAAYALAAAPLVAASDAFVATPAQTHQVVNTPAVASTHTAAAPQQEASSSSSSFAYGAVGVGIAGVAMARSSKKSSRVQKPQVSLCAFEEELGVQKPIGFWDPLGFTKDGDEGTFRRRRCVELKHGRVCMIASIGYIVPEYFKFEGYLSPSQGLKFADVPNGLAALSKVPGSGIAQFISFAGTLELWVFLDDPKRAPGDFENAGVLGLPLVKSTMEDGDKKKKRLSAEIANGRLAMMAIIGMFYQDGLTGSAWGDWSSYTDSPLRAFESELGVQAPVGFWDPLGFCADGDTKSFNRRRNTEIKHGRVSMWACTGYIVPEFVRWPGFCSPSQKIAFTEVPNGLAALSKVPGAGWTQMILFAGAIERGVLVADDSRPPGDFEAGGVLGVPNGSTMPDGEARNKKLNAELANGRLAMMAIIGMFFQDGLTGSAWGDWALYSESPLRAFEQESGVQAPVGYWDPLGLAADGNLYEFNRRRETELKHGRISMFATIGYIAPEYYKFEGFLSPAYGVKFSDIPNGLGAISKIPALGIAQFFLFIGLVEVNVYGEQKDGEPGNYGAGFLGCRSVGVMSTGFEDPDVRKKKLNAELANGRLAMMAIIGMFFQDGCTGSAWGDWSLYTESPLRFFNKGDATAPAATETKKTNTAIDISTQIGACPPLGFWDPLDLAQYNDPVVAERAFIRRRIVEIQHGRVSMMACIGYIVPEYFKFPGFCSPSENLAFADIPNGLVALTKIPPLGVTQMIAFVGIVEITNLQSPGGADYPGTYGYGAFGIPYGPKIQDKEKKEKSLLAEINNGRLAMMAIIGMFFQDGLTGGAWGDWANYTESPLRSGKMSPGFNSLPEYEKPLTGKITRNIKMSPGFNSLPEFEKPLTGFEGNIGDQPPLGFWDPAGFCKDGDVEIFLRRRNVEIKHGRVSMFACIGYIVPEYFKIPGDLSPSQGVTFSDVPNGLGALSKVPPAGFAQIFLFAGFNELVVNKPTGEPGNFGKGFLGLGTLGLAGSIQDGEVRVKKLKAELANGRLAMMAIIGMFFQDGLTGAAWGDWSLYTASPLR